MKQLIGTLWKRALRLGPEIGAHHVLWPASFPYTPCARGSAHALAAQLITITTCWPLIYFSRFSGLEWTVVYMLTMPTLMTGEVLRGRLHHQHGVVRQLLTAATVIVSAFTFPLYLWLFLLKMEFQESGIPVLVCWLVALAAGSSAAWVTWVASHGRARPVWLYTVWLTTISVTVVATLSAWLKAITAGR
ncbi:hypothetical protein [Streptomyces sp. NPDC096132]|uniref:hypothetical protein n=1 Tax=Streptomyces sp. NPDC096132 TaxID=3366075 RepID=UPI0038094AAE